MIFSTEMLMNNNSINENKNNYTDISYTNISFFVETLKYLSDENKNFNINMNTINITEGIITNYIKKSIKEKISSINPMNIIIKIIDGFMNILEKLWNRFEALCMNIISKNRNIEKYCDRIKLIDVPVEYDEPRFIYTNIIDDNSYTSFKNEINICYDLFVDQLVEFKKSNKKQSSEIIREKFVIDGTYYDSIRGKILGSKFKTCSSENFAKELFKYFRDGNESTIDSGDIQPTEVLSRLDHWEDFSKIVKSIKKYKSIIKDASSETQSRFRHIDLISYISDDINEDYSYLFNDIINDNISKVKKLCDIYLYYFSARLDAAKEEYISNTKILYAAAQKIVKEGLYK